MDEVKKLLLLIWLLCLAIFAMQFIEIKALQAIEARLDDMDAQCLAHLTTGETK